MPEFRDPVAGVRAQLNEEMSHVMDNTQPTPTQAELDAGKLGIPEPVQHRDAPHMRPLEEQQRMVADAEEERAETLMRDRAEREGTASPPARQQQRSMAQQRDEDAERRQQEQDEANRESARRQAAARAQQPQRT